jgi:hypothetical protein
MPRRPVLAVPALFAALVAALALAPSAVAFPRGSTLLRSGPFVDLDHAASGRATAYRLPGGARRVEFTSFRLAPGPNVHVYLVAGSPPGGDRYASRVDLGRLRSASGYQSYAIPAHVNLARHRTVLLWCVPFRVGLGRADLRLP